MASPRVPDEQDLRAERPLPTTRRSGLLEGTGNHKLVAGHGLPWLRRPRRPCGRNRAMCIVSYLGCVWCACVCVRGCMHMHGMHASTGSATHQLHQCPGGAAGRRPRRARLCQTRLDQVTTYVPTYPLGCFWLAWLAWATGDMGADRLKRGREAQSLHGIHAKRCVVTGPIRHHGTVLRPSPPLSLPPP